MVRPLDHRRIVLAASAWMLALSGCAGLHVGQQSLYRPEIRTIYVSVFESESFRPNLGERLTEAVVKEIERLISQGYRGSIGVVSPFRAQANRIRDRVYGHDSLAARIAHVDFLVDTLHKCHII